VRWPSRTARSSRSRQSPTPSNRAVAALRAEADNERKERESAHAAVVSDLTSERDELKRGLSTARDTIKRTEGELSAAVQTIADRNAELRSATAAIAERDQRITDLRKEIEAIEAENANYQEQVLRAYQKIKSDEAMVARAKKAMAIALTVLDDQSAPKSEPT
jgi:chromosome segregation ATPase